MIPAAKARFIALWSPGLPTVPLVRNAREWPVNACLACNGTS